MIDEKELDASMRRYREKMSLQYALDEACYVDSVGTVSGNTGPSIIVLAAAYREKCEECERLKRGLVEIKETGLCNLPDVRCDGDMFSIAVNALNEKELAK